MQAFDSVNRSTIHECIKQYKVPRKLIKLVQATLQRTKVKVKINNDMTEQFEITSGVKQGDPLSALLFSIVMDVIISKWKLEEIYLQGQNKSRHMLMILL